MTDYSNCFLFICGYILFANFKKTVILAFLLFHNDWYFWSSFYGCNSKAFCCLLKTKFGQLIVNDKHNPADDTEKDITLLNYDNY